MEHQREQEELMRDLAKQLKEVRHEDPHPIHKEEMELKVGSLVDGNSVNINQFMID